MASPTAEYVLAAQQRVDQRPDDVDARVELVSALVSFRLAQGGQLTADELGPHFLFFIANAPWLPATTSRDIVVPGTEWHRRLERAWQESIAKHFNSAEVLLSAARFYLDVDEDRAHELTGRAFDLAPQDEETRTRWGELQLKGVGLGRPDCSISLAAMLLDPLARFPPSVELAAMARLLNGDGARARELAHTALSLAGPLVPDYGHIGHTVLGLGCIDEGRAGAALDHLRESASHRVGAEGPWLRLASRLLQAGHVDAVAEFLTAMAAVWPAGRDRLTAWAGHLGSGGAAPLPDRLDKGDSGLSALRQ